MDSDPDTHEDLEGDVDRSALGGSHTPGGVGVGAIFDVPVRNKAVSPAISSCAGASPVWPDAEGHRQAAVVSSRARARLSCRDCGVYEGSGHEPWCRVSIEAPKPWVAVCTRNEAGVMECPQCGEGGFHAQDCPVHVHPELEGRPGPYDRHGLCEGCGRRLAEGHAVWCAHAADPSEAGAWSFGLGLAEAVQASGSYDELGRCRDCRRWRSEVHADGCPSSLPAPAPGPAPVRRVQFLSDRVVVTDRPWWGREEWSWTVDGSAFGCVPAVGVYRVRPHRLVGS
jgi:hypothetical protein